jgi:hypothetical protein
MFDSRKGKEFLLVHSVQSASGTHSGCYPMSTGVLFPKVKGQGRETDHSPPSSAEVENGAAIPPLFHTPSCRGAN